MLTTACRIYLAILSTYHVASGVLSYAFGETALRFYKAFYGTDPVERKHLMLILKPWGALSICVGLAGWTAVPDPGGHRGLVVAILILLLLRMAYRWTHRRELQALSRVPATRNACNIALLGLGAGLLACWLWWAP